MDTKTQRRAAIPIVLSGLVIAGALLVVARRSLLEVWYRFRLDHATGEARWELARELEESGEIARRVAEDWYIAQLEAWQPSAALLAGRKSDEAVDARKEVVRSSSPNRQITAFYYPDEKEIIPAAERLGAMCSARGIAALIGALERSAPDLPLVESPFVSLGQAPTLSPLLALHFTSCALYRIGEQAIPAVLELLASEDENVRFQAMYILDWLGVEEESAVRAVLRGHADSSRHIRQVAWQFMERHDAKGALSIPILVEGMRIDGEEGRDCGRHLVTLSEKSREAGRALGEALRDGTLPARRATLQYLGSHGEPTVSAAQLEPVLRELLVSEADPKLRTQAAYALRRTSASSPETIEALATALETDCDKTVRHGAVSALRDLAPASLPALPAIRAVLEDEYELVRRFARDALEKLGEE